MKLKHDITLDVLLLVLGLLFYSTIDVLYRINTTDIKGQVKSIVMYQNGTK